MHPIGLMPYQLHDIQLTTFGPSHRAKIRTQHPQSRPYALPLWQTRTNIDPTKLKLPLALGQNPGRSVVRTSLRFLLRRDRQLAITHHTIRSARSIILPLVVTPAARTISNVETPTPQIQSIA